MKNDNSFHIPVLSDEVLRLLDVGFGKKYIDATLGGGGHSKEILKADGRVLGIDQDQDAINFAKKELGEKYKDKLIIEKGNFSQMKDIAKKHNFKPDGILFDLGVSSYQLNTASRGFSFKSKSQLDMRMDRGNEISAVDVVNRYPYQDLVEIFQRFGEEHLATDIAAEIVKTRKVMPITTTYELSTVIEGVYSRHGVKSHISPATKAFQAIRMEVNSEVNALKLGLVSAEDLLSSGGRLAVISYHSIEDRIVKLEMNRPTYKELTLKPITASSEEIDINPRSRSAKLRVSIKL